MKTYIFLQYGYETPTEEIMDAWKNWFASLGDKLVAAVPFGPGREITHDGTKELSRDLEAITGYAIIHAEDLDEAERIAKDCPIITGVRVYETISM